MEVPLTTQEPFNCKGWDISSNRLLHAREGGACALTRHVFYLRAD